jgi:hypothetical protein
MNITTSAKVFIPMEGICLDRFLGPRSALRKPGMPFDFPPQRGGLRSLSVEAGRIATESRAIPGLLS